MRGTHLMLGRQDFTEPEQLSQATRRGLAAVVVTPRSPDRTKPHNWHAVTLHGQLIGFVTTRLGGQLFRRTEDTDWRLAAHVWHSADCDHAHAILALLGDAQEAA